jgi:hypothetical protein
VRAPALAAALCALAVLAGCGTAGSGGVSLDDAKRDVVIACRQGATDALDAKLCRCIADEAVTHREYDTPQELLTLTDQQQAGAKLPPVLDAIVNSCARRLG